MRTKKCSENIIISSNVACCVCISLSSLKTLVTPVCWLRSGYTYTHTQHILRFQSTRLRLVWSSLWLSFFFLLLLLALFSFAFFCSHALVTFVFGCLCFHNRSWHELNEKKWKLSDQIAIAMCVCVWCMVMHGGNCWFHFSFLSFSFLLSACIDCSNSIFILQRHLGIHYSSSFFPRHYYIIAIIMMHLSFPLKFQTDNVRKKNASDSDFSQFDCQRVPREIVTKWPIRCVVVGRRCVRLRHFLPFTRNPFFLFNHFTTMRNMKFICVITVFLNIFCLSVKKIQNSFIYRYMQVTACVLPWNCHAISSI